MLIYLSLRACYVRQLLFTTNAPHLHRLRQYHIRQIQINFPFQSLDYPCTYTFLLLENVSVLWDIT